MKTKTTNKTIQALKPVAWVLEAQADSLLLRLCQRTPLAEREGRLTLEKALERLLNALAMPDDSEVQKATRLAALEDSLPTAEGDAFCMAVEAGNILEILKALGGTTDFPELAKHKTALEAVCTAYWEATEGAGPSWWHE